MCDEELKIGKNNNNRSNFGTYSKYFECLEEEKHVLNKNSVLSVAANIDEIDLQSDTSSCQHCKSFLPLASKHFQSENGENNNPEDSRFTVIKYRNIIVPLLTSLSGQSLVMCSTDPQNLHPPPVSVKEEHR